MRLQRFLAPALMAAGAALILFGPAALAASGNFGLDTAAGTTIPVTGDIATIIAKIVRQALAFVGTIFLLLMVYAGFTYMTARGDDAKIKTAKGMITGAVIGIVIIAMSYALTSFVISALATSTSGTSATSSSTPTQTTPADLSVPVGGDCTATSQCTPASSTVCENGKCVSTVN
jgi:hypothetical protein